MYGKCSGQTELIPYFLAGDVFLQPVAPMVVFKPQKGVRYTSHSPYGSIIWYIEGEYASQPALNLVGEEGIDPPTFPCKRNVIASSPLAHFLPIYLFNFQRSKKLSLRSMETFISFW